MERSPAEVSMRRHSPEPADLEQLSSDTTRFTRTTESYRARKRQFEKKPGSIWSVTSRSSLAIPIVFSLCAWTTYFRLPFIRRNAVLELSAAPLIVCALPRWLLQTSVHRMRRWIRCILWSGLVCPATLQVLSGLGGERGRRSAIRLYKRSNIVLNIKSTGLSLCQDCDVRCRVYPLSPPSPSCPPTALLADRTELKAMLSGICNCFKAIGGKKKKQHTNRQLYSRLRLKK